MPSTKPELDWIDGFLVVGNQPVLDLLNTLLMAGEEEQEMLTDTTDLVRWLQMTGLVTALQRERLKHWSEQAEAKTFLNDLLLFRELVRKAVFALEEGRHPSRAFLEDLNVRLSAHPFRVAVTRGDGGLCTMQAEGVSIADTLWAALLQQAVKLFTDADPARVRQCESCIVHFYDTSKKNARRWCSMRLCGNRLKVAAYQERQRAMAR